MAQHEQTFQVRIAARRNAILPRRLLELLELGEGDFIKIVATASQIIEVRLLRGQTASLFSAAIRAILDEREKQLDAGQGDEICDLTTLSKRRPLKVRTANAEKP